MERSKYIKKVKRIVIKVGTSIVTTDTGRVDNERVSSVANQLAGLHKQGYEVLLVSSGSIAIGLEALGIQSMPTLIPDLQASASVGQGLLIHKYSEFFKKKSITVGQVLLTQHDTIHRQQYVNAKNTLCKLLDLGVIPIINENDSTAVDEIKFGDNDTLAALVANISGAKLLIILSDIDGLYDADPKSKKAKLIPRVDKINKQIEDSAGGVGTLFGKGGMETKISAAKMAVAGQTAVIIANGHKENILARIMKGERIGTFFVPGKNKISARKLWILNQRVGGVINVDNGAAEAIIGNGKSLLAVGVTGALGSFDMGDIVSIKAGGNKNHVIAKGITNYSSQELSLIAGKKNLEIRKIFNGETSEEVIHRDDMVILGN